MSDDKRVTLRYVDDMYKPNESEQVTVISVCYNSMGVVPAMLASLPAETPVVIVDNASSDRPALEAAASAHGARLIRNEENRGFGVACNQGAAVADTEFLLFLNPDAALTPKALEALVGAAAQYPDAVVMNPRIEEADGSAYFKRSSVLLPRAAWLKRGWPERDCEVPVLSGAALFVRREDFEAIGGFDPLIFLYHEDDDLSLRLKVGRGRLMFIREAAVRHQGGRSSARSPEVAKLKAWHMGRSRIYAARKHGQNFAATRAIGSALIQIVSPLVLLSPRKRAKQVGFMLGVVSGAQIGRANPPQSKELRK
ncbi:N-acetylglucosaminyl-diphospho-decaprenol L-rhamnosyltransferase [mine drainage metagenome]|uniref:N-acetylglucosaminyl-diphospho-decaprenol L-rhamnosyltransferase n=1 Tax=mine drainage metagenome TaxID=410659 RepID=A0A1J5P979_9ZZZZ